ncbi:MAG: PEP-CTERM sorting domain-containing protein [Phycisphaerales bacterium]|nr:PEP-CTERM sorting domain-containing protein [Phycisphaerales bacterium]MBT7171394.1 PEP-CTERM sorting domain-containing protein [Phycisphaerales bacterium]
MSTIQRQFFYALILSISPLATAAVNTFDDIDHWTGSGENQAAMVIDWHDGSGSAKVWGIQFDGTITVDSAVRQVLAADSRLYGVANGSFWMAYGYDTDSAGQQGVTIPAGTSNPYTPTAGVITYDEAWSMPGSTPLDSNDYYGSDDGVASTSWGLYVPDTTAYDDNGTPANFWDDWGTVGAATSYSDITFSASAVGGSVLNLQDGSWFASSFGDYDGSWIHQTPPSASAGLQAASVPEPMTLSLMAMGGLGLLRRRRKATN